GRWSIPRSASRRSGQISDKPTFSQLPLPWPEDRLVRHELYRGSTASKKSPGRLREFHEYLAQAGPVPSRSSKRLPASSAANHFQLNPSTSLLRRPISCKQSRAVD